jgi:hypothetical protein
MCSLDGIRVYTPIASPRALYFEVTCHIFFLPPVRLEALKPLTRRMVYHRIFPSVRLVQLIADQRIGQKKCHVGKMHGALRKKKKQFIPDEVCPLKLH